MSRLKLFPASAGDGRLLFEVEARDEVDLISKGKRERFIVNKDKFDSKVREKIAKKGGHSTNGK